MNLNTKVAITKTQGVIIVTMHPDLDKEDFDAMRDTVLEKITSTMVKAVIIDFSAVDVINLQEFNRVRLFLNSVRLLGAETAIVSLSAGIVVYLTEVQAETGGVHFFFGLDEALQRFADEDGE